MFTVGQILILGLAGSIYVVGAAFLLGGWAGLRSGRPAAPDVEGGQVVRAGTINGAPHFIPALDDTVSAPSTSDRSSRGEGPPRAGQARSSRPLPRRGRAETAPGSLRTPICLN
ncbi:hypothetical protein [Salinibacter altiplanensis]|uniref:hypothetical protein n=1 Tax=Salinibacter altiplanensis TaxID=1803181 RepID=UPI000C9FC873|nr:hypothetical protein [Salinibacter altiplanensis]